MTLDAHEFIRRFLLHTLPDGFHRIRHYGFLANGHRAQKLELCRRLLNITAQESAADTKHDLPAATPASRCSWCGGQMIMFGIWRCGEVPRRPFWTDSS